jgi:hypothetical protein
VLVSVFGCLLMAAAGYVVVSTALR